MAVIDARARFRGAPGLAKTQPPHALSGRPRVTPSTILREQARQMRAVAEQYEAEAARLEVVEPCESGAHFWSDRAQAHRDHTHRLTGLAEQEARLCDAAAQLAVLGSPTPEAG